MTAPVPQGGLGSPFKDEDDLLPPMTRWQQLAGIRAIVGSCRVCGGDLQPIEPDEHSSQGEAGEITWYEVKCRTCGKETAAPNGRTFRRSSLHRETPRGWLDRREKGDGDQRRARPGH